MKWNIPTGKSKGVAYVLKKIITLGSNDDGMNSAIFEVVIALIDRFV